MGSGRERGSWLETLAKVTAAVVAVGCGASNGDEAAGAATGALPLSRIALENQLPGSEDYQVSVHVEHRELEAYAGAVSVTGGEALDVHVNVSVRSAVKWQLFRLGYYRGRGARRLADGLVTEVQPEPDCPVDRHTGLIECSWDTTFAIPIDPKWVSGYYLVKLTRDDGFESTVPFVVRESEPTAPVLVQASMNTWQAYNRWGGASLYHNDLGSKAFKATHAFRVSYDRPYGTGDGAGRLFDLEIWLVKWLEERGVEVAYTTNVDVDRAPETLLSRRIVVVSGHDEYWTLGERRALEATRDAGVSLAVLSANTGYWRVRFDPSSAGADRRIITCYKSAKDDPDDDAPDTTVRFRDAPHARPENELTGVLYQLGDYPLASLPTYVADPTHWVFEGTGVKTGDRLGVTLGGEWDEAISDASEPAGVEFVTASPAFDSSGGVTSSAGALYAPTDHSFVFASGSEQFALGLSEPHTVAPRTQRVLHNLLVRAGVADPAPLTPCAPTPRTVWPGQVSVLAGSGEAGHHDGPATEALFDAPGGLALGADGTLYVTESRNHDVRALAPDGTVSTLAGCGPFGSRDGGYASGTGKDACFNRPNGIAVRDDGVVFVADTANHLIRAITAAGKVTNYAGGHAGDADGARQDAQFDEPMGIAFGSDGSLYVVDPGGSVRRIDAAGQVTTLTKEVKGATAVAVAPDGSIYAASPATGRLCQVRGGEVRVLTDADGMPGSRVSGDDVKSPLDAWLRPSFGLVVNGGRLAFADTANDAVRELVLGPTSDTSSLVTLVGPTAPDATLAAGGPVGLMLPRGVVAYGDGYAVADTGHERIVVVRGAEGLGAVR